jgi:hypothetical protein
LTLLSLENIFFSKEALQFCEWIKIEKPEAATSGLIKSYRKQPEAQNVSFI